MIVRCDCGNVFVAFIAYKLIGNGNDDSERYDVQVRDRLVVIAKMDAIREIS